MVQTATRWNFSVERGPDWLFICIHSPASMQPDEQFAEAVWEMLETQFTRRVVLEVGELRGLPSWLVGQLVKLHKRVHAGGGMLRLCGLSDANQAVLQTSRLDDRFPQYRDRREAVMGCRPTKPR